MTEAELQRAVIVALSKDPCVRLWRQNVGVAVPLHQLRLWLARRGYLPMSAPMPGDLHPVRYCVPGAGDLSGLVGPTGRRLELEVKAPDGRPRVSTEQRNFGEMVGSLGGVWGVVQSLEEALEAVAEARQT